jgi:phage terminase large subunit-like protein
MIDELHAHKSRAVFDVLNTALGARRQPLLGSITTAGWDRNSVCWQQHTYAIDIIKGIREDDSLFAFIATIDKDDDPFDEKAWAKANPNLGISVKLDNLRAQANRARQMPAELNAFLRLHLNVWTEQIDRWMPMPEWDDCRAEYTAKDMEGRRCFGALDMSSTDDITAFSLVFPPDTPDGKWRTLTWYFVPRENIRRKEQKDFVDYNVWLRQKLIEATEGNIVDQAYVQHRICEICEKYNVVQIAYDRFNASYLVTNLGNEGLEMVQFGQGFLSMSAPTKMLSELVLTRKFEHNGDPVLRWMANNVSVAQDAAGNYKPDKSKSSEKIDGIVTTIMGIGLASVDEGDGKSVYEERGILSL